MERVLRDEVLALLKAREGKPLSGEEMSRALGVSRAAVWKAMESLRDEGYVISSAPRRGRGFICRFSSAPGALWRRCRP